VKKFYTRPYLSLLPFLLLYGLLIILQNDNALFGDEGRYLQFSHNLLSGFYSPPAPNINLWNGPGFPIYLMPFVAFNAPLLLIKLYNAILYYFTLVLFFKTLLNYTDEKKSFISTVILGCYYMPFKGFPHILSETLVIFLVASITYTATKFFSKSGPDNKLFILLALLLAFLALTKVIFGTVFLIAGIFFLLWYIITGKRSYRNSFLLMFMSLLFCLPYLIYTYSITGRVFYWSNAGGMSLYWMSNPVEGEYGEWYNDSLTSQRLDKHSQELLKANHSAEYSEINSLTGIERDDRYKAFAIQHVREHPGKISCNWLANISRMFFNYPVGYKPFSFGTALNMIANIPLLVLLIYATLLSWKRRREIPFALKFLLMISFIYLFGSSLLSAYDRMLYILIPVLGCWIGYTIMVFRLRSRAENNSC
jgi:hypothetical protein